VYSTAVKMCNLLNVSGDLFYNTFIHKVIRKKTHRVFFVVVTDFQNSFIWIGLLSC